MLARALLALVIAVSLSACGPAKPPLLKTNVSVDSEVNPDSHGRASPIVVRVFELKSLSGFNAADFFTLYEKESEALGGDLVSKEELRMRPGDSVTLSHPLAPETKFVAALAAFRDLEKSRWRSAAPVPVKKKQIDMTVAIRGKAVAVTVVP
jgi:type VI secretion system protein VasD